MYKSNTSTGMTDTSSMIGRGHHQSLMPTAEEPDKKERLVAKLAERNKAQGQLLQVWKQRLKEQNEMLFRLHREREEQMRLLTSQLLLLEANLRSKQNKIDGMLNQRDKIISDQREQIRGLERELEQWRRSAASASISAAARPPVRPKSLPLVDPRKKDEGSPSDRHGPHDRDGSKEDTDRRVRPNLMRLLGHENEESLEDSDSAVVIEDDPNRHSPTFTSGNSQVKVIRSISDVVACARANLSISQGPLDHHRRTIQPEVEEEAGEDEDDDADHSGSSSEDSPFNQRGKKSFLRGSFERMPVQQHHHLHHHHHQIAEPTSLVRSLSASIPRSHCSNHRSVTRPRDVKSKKRTHKSVWSATTRSSLVEGSLINNASTTPTDGRGLLSSTTV